MYFPYFQPANFSVGTSVALNAAGEKVAMIGRLYIEGRAASKTIDTTGSSAIQFRTAGVTFSNAGSTLDIGIQDVVVGTGPLGRPDGTFDVLTTLTGGGGSPTANAWQTIAMTSGTKTMAHGDLIAVVWDMTARGGADAVNITPGSASPLMGFPFFTTNIDGAGWLTSNNPALPNCVITFSDGTLGYLDFAMPISVQAVETFRDADNPDERGLAFQVPWSCKIDALWATVGGTNVSSACNLTLYSDPFGTPTYVVSTAILIEQLGVAAASQRPAVFNISTEQTLLRNTDYAIAIRATGTTSTRILSATLGAAAHRTFFPGGTTLVKYTRDGGSGAFGTAVSTTIYQMGVRISQFDDGTGSGSGSAGVMYNPNLSGT